MFCSDTYRSLWLQVLRYIPSLNMVRARKPEPRSAKSPLSSRPADWQLRDLPDANRLIPPFHLQAIERSFLPAAFEDRQAPAVAVQVLPARPQYPPSCCPAVVP